MAGGSGGRSLEVTPTWAVAVWLKRKHKRALYEALEKIKSELMLLGFISLLLTVTQSLISDICISKSIGATWHPCSESKENETSSNDEEEDHRRKLLANKVPLVSADGIHQLHIFIFVLAVFHVLYCILTLALGRAKMRSWKAWEKETRTVEYQFSNDPERFRFARETSFGRRHLSVWTKKPILMWIAHLAPQTHSNFDFQKYINRSLEEDFKVVVGISPPIWFFAVLFLLFNTNGWYSYLWLPFIPLIIILLVGTKLQVIITKMGLSIQERGEVVKGVPVVQPGDDLFWFNRPRLILYLINFVLFQNAFQLAFFAWTWYEFGLKSCFHERLEDVIIRISMGILVQILCSYVTLPLYALVTQMGSTMKPTIFNERIAEALRNWHHTAKKHIKQSHHRSGKVTSMSTPSHHASPVHLLRRYRSDMDDSLQASPARLSNFEIDHRQSWEDTDGGSISISPSPSHHPQQNTSPPLQHHRIEIGHVESNSVVESHGPSSSNVARITELNEVVEQHEIEIEIEKGIGPKVFSFARRESP
ncbi:MLO-like protein [Actinidia chinensis var. chinensis]|uniref:MLO-like protein n=1 Tax=Actinidia chinensis var. chinensis TaxID=1590841 RepID=A0A2R6P7H9_ACTCC|nr:MLO-like protein [Actinidia chinensis var. chinensis]